MPNFDHLTIVFFLNFPQAGTWETKVSNREKKKQHQRRKDKGSEDSCSPGGPQAPKAHVETPVVTVTAKKNKGNNGIFLQNCTPR